MSKSRSVSQKTSNLLWGKSAGRCNICNKKLYEDSAYSTSGNYGEKAHIHAFSKGGPRNSSDIEEEEINSYNNLILLCQEHHKMIDDSPEEYPVDVLMEYKKNHENLIEELTDHHYTKTSVIISYFHNIDKQEIIHSDTLLKKSLISNKLLAKDISIVKLNKGISSLEFLSFKDCQNAASGLERSFKRNMDNIIAVSEMISIFALAPQPLLIKLGILVNDQYSVNVFQCDRDEKKWILNKKTTEKINFEVHGTIENPDSEVALVIDLSAQVINERITAVLGENVQIIHLTVSNPNRGIVTDTSIQNNFVSKFREIMEYIKNKTNATCIHLFPCMPNSLAIRLGMDLMPKTDLPFIIYDQFKNSNTFEKALEVLNDEG